jgi:LmbE family N-acetylglucosaminyl deacetylase
MRPGVRLGRLELPRRAVSLGDANAEFRVFRRDRELAGVSDVFAPWAKREHWLFVSPHDDDALIGAGLWIQALLSATTSVTIAIVTDGRMGYTDPAGRETIVARRKDEADRAYHALGLAPGAVRHLGFPDGSLVQHSGSRLEAGKPAGLDCALTRVIREFKPTRIVTTDSADWHPDHRATFDSARMSVFHACGDIWAELGEPLKAMPALYTFAVYAPFVTGPDFLIEARGAAKARKLRALGEFTSQAGIIERVSKSAGQEYLCGVPTSLHDAAAYRSLFPK